MRQASDTTYEFVPATFTLFSIALVNAQPCPSPSTLIVCAPNYEAAGGGREDESRGGSDASSSGELEGGGRAADVLEPGAGGGNEVGGSNADESSASFRSDPENGLEDDLEKNSQCGVDSVGEQVTESTRKMSEVLACCCVSSISQNVLCSPLIISGLYCGGNIVYRRENRTD